MKKISFLKKNGLSIALLILFLAFWAGQALTGWQVYNEELSEDNGNPVPFLDYLASGHFVSATFENWESEFLQMFIFVVFSIFLYQHGSPESNPIGEKDKQPDERNSPHWAVRQGGMIKWFYANSLSITLFAFFLLSFLAHSWGSFRHHQTEQLLKKENPEFYYDYIMSKDFWFESFQNWQSEFLAVFVIVYFTVFLRQHGSPQSKKVDSKDDDYE
jgi:glycerol uptake facilitator-like aquaporin